MPRSNRVSGKSLTAGCCGKGLAQECAAEPQALAVDAVPDPLRHVPLDRKAGMGEGDYGRDLPAHPVSAKDEALWAKAY